MQKKEQYMQAWKVRMSWLLSLTYTGVVQTHTPLQKSGIKAAAIAATWSNLTGTGIIMNDNVFLGIPMASQQFHAIGLANAEATVRNNYVNQYVPHVKSFLARSSQCAFVRSVRLRFRAYGFLR